MSANLPEHDSDHKSDDEEVKIVNVEAAEQAWAEAENLSDDDVASDSDFSDEKEACNCNDQESEPLPFPVSIAHRNEVSKIGTKDDQREVIKPNPDVINNPHPKRTEALYQLRDGLTFFAQKPSTAEFDQEKERLVAEFNEKWFKKEKL